MSSLLLSFLVIVNVVNFFVAVCCFCLLSVVCALFMSSSPRYLTLAVYQRFVVHVYLLYICVLCFVCFPNVLSWANGSNKSYAIGGDSYMI